jgi:tetratricopeptide (TPR) repeat protein
MIKQPGMSRTYATWTEFIEKGGTGFAGGAPGLNAVVIMMPAKKYHFILLSNYDEGTAEQVATRFTAILNNKNPEPFGTKPSEIPTVLYDFIKKNGQTGFHDFYISTFKKSGIPLDNDMILLHAGQRFLEEKNADGAIALYSVYTQDFPQIIVAKNDLADAYLLKGDKENAIKWYKKALELRPNNPRAKEALKRLGQ